MKVACPVWMRGKSVSSYLCIQGREVLPIVTLKNDTALCYENGVSAINGVIQFYLKKGHYLWGPNPLACAMWILATKEGRKVFKLQGFEDLQATHAEC